MASSEGLGRLAEQKELLLAQSEVLRLTMVLECQRLEPTARWVDRGYGLSKLLRPALPVLAPIVAALAVRGWRKLGGVAAGGALLVGLYKKARVWWRVIRPGR